METTHDPRRGHPIRETNDWCHFWLYPRRRKSLLIDVSPPEWARKLQLHVRQAGSKNVSVTVLVEVVPTSENDPPITVPPGPEALNVDVEH